MFPAFGASTNFRPSVKPQETKSISGANSPLFSVPPNLFAQVFNKNQSVFNEQKTNQMEVSNNQVFKLNDKVGTEVTFKPVQETESSHKVGSSTVTGANYQSITFMKEYENKSLEELRLEDYLLNRKGARTSPFFNNPTICANRSTKSSTRLFSSTIVPNFGVKINNISATNQNKTLKINLPTVPSLKAHVAPNFNFLNPPNNQTASPIQLAKPSMNMQQQIITMASNPYGMSNLLDNILISENHLEQCKRITSSMERCESMTNPMELNSKQPQIFAKKDKITPVLIREKKDVELCGLEDKTLISNIRLNIPKRSIAHKNEIQNDCNNVIIEKSMEGSEIFNSGIILTRSEYYTIPPLEELSTYLNEDGSCFVQGFTIGRYGYGNVHFPDSFDVSNLNLDELVHFRHKEIIIYPDETVKPPLGQGLNRRAQITLDKVWPKDKQTKKTVNNVKYLMEIEYANKLRDLCNKQGTKFVDYMPETGSWVFRVDHF